MRDDEGYLTPFERHQFENEKKNPVKAKNNVVAMRSLPWADEVKANYQRAPRAQNPSHIHVWYFAEKAKSDKGLQNELDVHEIYQAARGAKNKWSAKLKTYPDKFQALLAGKKIDTLAWQEIMELI